MDTLSELIGLLRAQGQVFGRLLLSDPFGLALPGQDKSVFLLMGQGSAWLGVDDQPLLRLRERDLVFLAAPQSYTLRSTPDGPLVPAESVVPREQFHRERVLRHGGGGPEAQLVAGCFSFSGQECGLLIRHLPPIIHIPAGTAERPWLRATIQLLIAETGAPLPGSGAIVDRLAEVLFLQAVRAALEGPGAPNWLRALTHPQIGESLRLMHDRPGHPWSVPELARHASMSRSAFADRFRRIVGETPVEHLTRWRMMRAGHLLLSTRQPLAEVAAQLGYESESAFGKAFRRSLGETPGAYRRRRLLP